MASKITLKDWKNLQLSELLNKYNLTLGDMYIQAISESLHKVRTPTERRLWNEVDEDFIIKYKDKLTIKEISCVVHKSYYATLGKIKMMGLYEMIKK